jgi:hypothetical protein
MQTKSFDPLDAEQMPPEMCGYGLRVFQLDLSSSNIKVKASHKNTAELNISIHDIIKPVIPTITLDIIKQKQHKRSKKHAVQDSLLDESELTDSAGAGSISQLAKLGIVNRNSNSYKLKCATSSYLPFGITLEKGGALELIATSYETMKQMTFAIDFLAQNKKQLGKIQTLLQLANYHSV